jgi:F0F1-type ATP synthase epsilon subunit
MQIKPLILTVKSRNGVILAGTFKSVTSNNDKGRFDVLSYHANFISLIRDYVEYIGFDDKKGMLPIRDAVMRVDDNKVDVFMGI